MRISKSVTLPARNLPQRATLSQKLAGYDVYVPATPKLDYRADIDGLRAVAVLSVLFFHADIQYFSGGFIGVDVFFVISGYLITKMILSASEAGTFSYANFYARRSRRLFPALLTTIVATFIAGIVLFLPVDFARLSGATASALLAVSNIFFWSESGYFDVDAKLKPLLHTWSLGVEEQFYILWPPLIAFLIGRLSRSSVIWIIAATIVIGFVASLLMMEFDQTAAFFLMPFRIYEFALGILVVLYEDKKPRDDLTVDVIYIVGLACILFGVFAYDDLTTFPGFSALPPVVGTALAIYAGRWAKVAALLRVKPMRNIGLISYSLYLVHWPIIVFLHYILGRQFGWLDKLAIVVASFALAVCLYSLIERPFRRPDLAASDGLQAFYVGCACIATVTLIPASHGWLTDGWVWRFPVDLQAINNIDIEKLKKYVWDNHTKLQSADDFKTDKPHLLVLGDSQAADLTNLLLAGGIDKKFEIVTRGINTECGIPLLPLEEAKAFWNEKNPFTMKDKTLISHCTAQYDRLTNTRALKDANYVIIGYFWRDSTLSYMDDFITEIRQRTHAKIYIFSSKAFKYSGVDMVNRLGGVSGIEKFAYESIGSNTKVVNEYLRKRFGDSFIDLISYICPRRDYCHVLTDDGKPIYFDTTHFSSDGVNFIARSMTHQIFGFLT
jgi:peptidoglycan/LPS O-acetylase OafA/YrhL